MKVTEIFKSIDGEGKRAGLPTTFIRLYGCNLRCSYCDSMYSVENGNYTEMSIDEILEEVRRLGIPRITLTGGEPLIHGDVVKLLEELDNLSYDVNVETNGAIYPDSYMDFMHVWYTIDYKLPSSGMESLMNEDLFNNVCSDDVVKFVIGSDEDLNCVLDVLYKYNFECSIYLSPVFGYDASKIVDYMMAHNLINAHVQLQLHKYIWDPEKRGV